METNNKYYCADCVNLKDGAPTETCADCTYSIRNPKPSLYVPQTQNEEKATNPTIDNELNNDCITPDYKGMYEDVVKEAEYWKQECQRQTSEVIYLRAVKQTAEAFLGRKIGDGT